MRMKSGIPNDQMAKLDEVEKKMYDNIAMLDTTLR